MSGMRENVGLRGWIFGGMLIALLSGCLQEPASGSVEVKWDRDTCVRCNMALSDRHFAAQVRGGDKRKIVKFDDFGCAIFWLEKQAWAHDPATEFWVMDYSGNEVKWLDARKSHYVPGKTSPMGYGFAAVALPVPGSVTFEEARKQILAKGK